MKNVSEKDLHWYRIFKSSLKGQDSDGLYAYKHTHIMIQNSVMVVGVGMVFLGVLLAITLIGIVIGIPLIGAGIWAFFNGRKSKQRIEWGIDKFAKEELGLASGS